MVTLFGRLSVGQVFTGLSHTGRMFRRPAGGIATRAVAASNPLSWRKPIALDGGNATCRNPRRTAHRPKVLREPGTPARPTCFLLDGFVSLRALVQGSADVRRVRMPKLRRDLESNASKPAPARVASQNLAFSTTRTERDSIGWKWVSATPCTASPFNLDV